jgi:hypothetical protein
MAFSQTSIISVNPPRLYGVELLLSWTSSAAAGTVYQVYVNDVLEWDGTALSCTIAAPAVVSRIDIGTIAGTDSPTTNFAADLPSLPDRTVLLTWQGGTFESPTIAGFNVYGSPANGSVDYTTALATVSAYTAGITTDGFGYGGYGDGGFGEAAGSYSWQSGALTSGTWTFGIVPFDTAGNTGPAQTASATIAVPPSQPPPFPNGVCLEYSYNPSTQVVTLYWNASTE